MHATFFKKLLPVGPLLALATLGLVGGCKFPSSSPPHSSPNGVNPFKQAKDFQTILHNAGMKFGYYKFGGSERYCTQAGVVQEYHLKPLDKHQIWDPIYGAACFYDDVTRMDFVNPADRTVLLSAQVASNSEVTLRWDNSSTGKCSSDGTIAKYIETDDSYEGLVDKLLRTVVSLKICNKNGKVLEQGAVLRKRIRPGLVPFSEYWEVRPATGEGQPLAIMWSNPFWGSWSIEDNQQEVNNEAVAVGREALLLLPMLEEARRRFKASKP